MIKLMMAVLILVMAHAITVLQNGPNLLDGIAAIFVLTVGAFLLIPMTWDLRHGIK